MSTNLIDAYVSEVGRRLPGKTRTDIQAEIRSILQDMLEECSQKTGKPVDDELTFEVLRDYGAPEKVAATYVGERYLIGPRLYPIFTQVLRIGLIVIGVLAAVGLGIAIYQTTLTPVNAFATILRAVANFAATALTVLGNIVLIFAILEWALFRTGGKLEVKGFPKEKEWDPHSLLNISPSNQVRLGETIAEIVGSFAAIVIFNFYPQIIGFTTSLNGLPGSGNWVIGFGSGTFTPLLSQAFFYYVPYLTGVWVLTILLDIVLLRIGHWNTPARISQIGLKLISILIAVLILNGSSILAINAQSLTNSIGDATAANTLMTLLNDIVHVALWLAIIGSSIEIIRSISRMVTNNLPSQISVKS